MFKFDQRSSYSTESNHIICIVMQYKANKDGSHWWCEPFWSNLEITLPIQDHYNSAHSCITWSKGYSYFLSHCPFKTKACFIQVYKARHTFSITCSSIVNVFFHVYEPMDAHYWLVYLWTTRERGCSSFPPILLDSFKCFTAVPLRSLWSEVNKQ